MIEGTEQLLYELHYVNPCPVLSEYDEFIQKQIELYRKPSQSPIKTESAKPPAKVPNSRPSITSIQHQDPQQSLAVQPKQTAMSNKNANMVMQSQVPATSTQPPELDNDFFSEEELQQQLQEYREPMQEVYTKEEAIRLGLIPTNRTKRATSPSTQMLLQKCNAAFQENVVKSISRFNQQHHRGKRQGWFLAGFVICDFIRSIRDHLAPRSSLDDRMRSALATIQAQNRQFNMLALTNKIDQHINQKSLNAISNLEGQVFELPYVNLLANRLIRNMEAHKSLHDRLFYGRQQDQDDHIAISTLFLTNQFGKILGQDLKILDISNLAPNVLSVAVMGPVRSKNTKVYEVHALTHYVNTTGKAAKAEYVGKRFLAHNETARCVSAIDTSMEAAVDVKCDAPNYVSPELRHWRYSPVDLDQEQRKSVAFISWPKSIVYCWGNNISVMADGQMEHTACPTYAFYLNSSNSFNTSDGIVNHKGGAKIVSFETEHFEFHTENVHFEDFRSAHKDITDNLKTIRRLQQALDKETKVASFGQLDISYRHTTYLSLGAGAAVVVLAIVLYLRKKLRNVRIVPVFWEPRPSVEQVVQRELRHCIEQMRTDTMIEFAEPRRQSRRRSRRVSRDFPLSSISITEIE